MRKTQILTNELVCLGLSILDLTKTVMYELWYDYPKLKYEKKVKTLLYRYRKLHFSCKNTTFRKSL